MSEEETFKINVDLLTDDTKNGLEERCQQEVGDISDQKIIEYLQEEDE